MASTAYDVIVVGARCAGSSVAMLLARRGYKVLVADKATFPSDTISTHLVHPPGVAALDRWGLLERLVATGCAAMGDYQSTRDTHVLPMYELTAQLASLEPAPPDMRKVLGAVHGNQEAMDGFVRVQAGVTSPAEFFSEENVKRIFAAAGP